MKNERLMDAMAYIGDDLIGEVDELRRGVHRYVPVARWMSLAACFCLIALGIWTAGRMLDNGEIADGIPESPVGEMENTGGDSGLECAPEAAGNTGTTDGTSTLSFVPERVQYIRTDGYHEDAVYPVITVIRSEEALTDYYAANRERYDMERREKVYSDSTIGFLDAADGYDDAFFAEHDLLLILLESGSGSVRFKVEELIREADGWSVRISSHAPEVCTDDMAVWHLIVETEKNRIGTDDIIRVK